MPGRNRKNPAATFAVFGAMLLGACATPTPSPSASPTSAASSSAAPSATPSASAAAAPAACGRVEIDVIGGPWGGAAGSRGSDVVVENRGLAACLLPPGPTIALVDQAATVLLANTPAQVGTGPSIEPGGRIGFSLLFGNWCKQPVSLPLHFRLALAGDAVDIRDLAVTTSDDLPPCNGPEQPASLSTTDWEPR